MRVSSGVVIGRGWNDGRHDSAGQIGIVEPDKSRHCGVALMVMQTLVDAAVCNVCNGSRPPGFQIACEQRQRGLELIEVRVRPHHPYARVAGGKQAVAQSVQPVERFLRSDQEIPADLSA